MKTDSCLGARWTKAGGGCLGCGERWRAWRSCDKPGGGA